MLQAVVCDRGKPSLGRFVIFEDSTASGQILSFESIMKPQLARLAGLNDEANGVGRTIRG